MGKKRKTREQKIISDLRRRLYSKTGSTPVEKTTTIGLPSANPTAFKIPIVNREKSAVISLENDYSYLSRDLKKTSFLIGLAILLQLVLYLALR